MVSGIMGSKRGMGARRRLAGLAIAGAAALALSACQAPVQVHGNDLDADAFAEIRPGEHTRSDVAALLGSPSVVSTFEDNSWYYIGDRTTQIAFFRPTVHDRNVFVVSFNEADVVAETRNYTLEDGQEVAHVSRETPTEGRQISVLEQLIGNLGRFDGAAPMPSGPEGPGPRVPGPGGL